MAAEPNANFTPQQLAIENLADQMLAQMNSPIREQAIHAAIRAASDPEDLENRLVAILGDTDPEFQRQLEHALFAADVMGYAHADRK